MFVIMNVGVLMRAAFIPGVIIRMCMTVGVGAGVTVRMDTFAFTGAVARVNVVMDVKTAVGMYVIPSVGMTVQKQLILFCPVDLHAHVCSGYTAFFRSPGGKKNVRHAHAVEFADNFLPVIKKLQQRGREHVAGSTHRAVQI